ncbi:MAG: PDDEXK nuclease domain-containing protein [Algoriphagus sp.]|nr:PDDEXK nuclease domain-containing protein [Algoriphagus sp.]MDP3470921.1 PDDEXK nuclease domain-containing protein [Algoriphagus sp.]
MNFERLVKTISNTHGHFQQQAARAVNVSLTLRNWLIGFYIVEFELHGEDRSVYGDKLFDELAKRLKSIKGVDRRSLYRFKDFYLLYPQISNYITDNQSALFLPASSTYQIMGSATPQKEDFQKVGSVTPQSQNKKQVPVEKLITCLSYTHIEQLLQIKDLLKRTFYEIACIKGTWSVKELKRQINSLYYERSGLSTKPEMLSQSTQQKAEKASSSDIVKSVYAFEFLGLKVKNAVEESDLETALLDHLQDFMLEMGHGFCLEARQKKILIGDEYFFIDLVFYHRILKCHVLVELKVEDFNHYNIGQLNTYVNYYKAHVMQADDNPTVGILLVTNKNTALVEFATTGMDNKLFVSKYLLELPKKELLEAFITNELQKWNS